MSVWQYGLVTLIVGIILYSWGSFWTNWIKYQFDKRAEARKDGTLKKFPETPFGKILRLTGLQLIGVVGALISLGLEFTSNTPITRGTVVYLSFVILLLSINFFGLLAGVAVYIADSRNEKTKQDF